MYLKRHGFTFLLMTLALGFSGILTAQTPVVSSVAVTTATLHGHVVDPSGARIPGAAIAVTTAAGAPVATATSDATGAFEVKGLKPGAYAVQAVYSGFAPFQSPAITLVAGQVKHVKIQMAIEVAEQNVEVNDDTPTVSVEAGANANAIVIKGKDLDALSDDPDELASELQALAGPSAGPDGGQIYIDGFTGGDLPPKSAIREIRINRNPFSAEFDRLGYGRIEVFTKPGTDKLHGQAFIQGNDNAFNTGNPFTPNIPDYHSIQYNGTVSGPLAKWASYFFTIEQRDNQSAKVYSLAEAPVLDASTNLWSAEPLSGSLFNPHNRINISPRIDLQLGKKNTLTLRYEYEGETESGDIGSTQLPSQSSNSKDTDNTFQLSDATVVSNNIVNNLRIQYRRGFSSATPVSTAPQVSVPGVITGGGASGQQSNIHEDHLELQNETTVTVGAQTINFGAWLRDNREAASTNANFNGSFTFSTVADYVGALNLSPAGPDNFTCPTGSIVSGQTVCGSTNAPTKLTYTTGPSGATANVFDAALFFQDDWQANHNLTLSGGLRWETQNHIADHSDWGPRVAFAYALDGHKKQQPKTVLRGGFGIFYDRLSFNQLLQAERFNGGSNSQVQTTITAPTCFNSVSLSNIDLSTCGTSTSSTGTTVQIAPDFHAPYTEQFGTSLERQLTKATTLTLTYLHSFGVHQYVTRDSNAYNGISGSYSVNPADPSGTPSTTGTRPDGQGSGIVDQYYSEAVFKQNQLIVNVNARITPKLSVFGFYNLSYANTDGGDGTIVSNSYDLKQDYGRASFAARNMVFMMANYQGPWGISFNPFLIAMSGHPFNIVTSYDLTGDNFFNDRPSYATANSISSNVVDTSYGDFDTVPQPGETIIPANLGTGPAAVAFNLRVSRSFGIGPKVKGNGAGGPPQGGPHGGGGHHGGGPGGGLGPGGLNGGGGPPHGMFGSSGPARKYALTFSVHALNLFNDIDYGTPVGNVNAPNFGKSNNLNGGIFSSGSAARRIFAQAVFSF